MSHYDERQHLTRIGAQEVIASGGSVLLNGKLYASVDKLPSEAEFAKGDAKAEENARKIIQAQIDAAQAQLKTLDHPTPAKKNV